jgi:hypothetical protein
VPQTLQNSIDVARVTEIWDAEAALVFHNGVKTGCPHLSQFTLHINTCSMFMWLYKDEIEKR